MSLVRDIDLDFLDIRPDARNLDARLIEPLAISIAEHGLINPVRVREISDGRFEVVAGAHRVAAHRFLGLAEIAAIVAFDDDVHAELAMIDENLCRAELTPVERAHQIARRKLLYEQLHPEARHGGDRKTPGDTSADQVDKLSTRSFADETAALTGRDARSVRRDAERGAKVSDAVRDFIRVTPLNSGAFLDRIKNLPPEEQMRVARTELAELNRMEAERRRMRAEAKKHARAAREVQLAARQQALPQKRYGVIYADPEWRFEPRNRDTGMDRAADNHYPTSDLAEIKARPVAEIAAPDCVLFLWATVPMLPEALEVMRAWGFAYKSHVIWRKADVEARGADPSKVARGRYSTGLVLGTGYWFRNAHEILLVGTRGNVVAPAMGTQWPSVIDAAPLKHSQKPECFAGLIKDYFPNLPKIELNARTSRDGWDAWGNEIAPAEVDTGSALRRDERLENQTPLEAAEAPEAVSGGDGLAESAGEMLQASGSPAGCLEIAPAEVDTGSALRRDEGQEAEQLAQASPDANALIESAYAAGEVDLAALSQKTGLNRNTIKQRAKRRGWSDRANQRTAVAASNRARGKKEA